MNVMLVLVLLLLWLLQSDPKQINEISADFREECKKYGDVRKVTVYDVRFLRLVQNVPQTDSNNCFACKQHFEVATCSQSLK